MTFNEAPKNDSGFGGILEEDGQFVITDPEVLKSIEEREQAREQAVQIELEALQKCVNDMTRLLTSRFGEKISPKLLNDCTRVLEDSLLKIERLKDPSQTLH